MKAERLRAGLLDDPRLEVGREDPDGVSRETTWGVAWTPPIDGRRRWAVRAAEAGVEMEEFELASRRLRLRVEMRAAYAAWAVDQARKEVLRDHADRIDGLATRVDNRAKAGEVSKLAARRLGLASKAVYASLSVAKGSEAGSRERVAAWLEDPEVVTARRPVLPELPETPDRLDATTWAQRPDLEAARSRVEQAKSDERLSRRVAAAPELVLGWKQVEDPGGDLNGPVFAIGWKVPVFDRGRADRMAAQYALETAVADEEWRRRQARSEYTGALVVYAELRRSALEAQRELGGLENLTAAATTVFEQGETNVTDLLGTLRSILDTRLSALDLYRAALDAHCRLELAAGRPLTLGEPS